MTQKNGFSPKLKAILSFCPGTAILLSLVAACVAVQAQESSPEAEPVQWYQVEVFIFANDDPDAGGAENWPENVELQYPEQIVHLSDKGFNPVSKEELLALSTTLNPLEKDNATEPASSSINDPLLESYHIADSTSVATLQEAGELTDDAAIDATLRELNSEEEPFVTLDTDQLELRDDAARITRRRNFRTLFHKAWRQPVLGREQSPSVLIRGGDPYDDHYELEGSITLSVERYLHFKTDLWLSTFKSIAGLDYTPWPKLPPLPIASTAQHMDATDEGAVDGFSDSGLDSGLSYLNLREQQYEVDRTVVLRQSRRMRSGELHYIDHPLMGLLVKVKPYAPETTEKSPEQEQP